MRARGGAAGLGRTEEGGPGPRAPGSAHPHALALELRLHQARVHAV